MTEIDPSVNPQESLQTTPTDKEELINSNYDSYSQKKAEEYDNKRYAADYDDSKYSIEAAKHYDKEYYANYGKQRPVSNDEEVSDAVTDDIARTERRVVGLPETATDEELSAAVRASIPKMERKSFGLPETATDEEVSAAVTASIARTERRVVGLPETATDEEVSAAVRASLTKTEQKQTEIDPSVNPQESSQTTPIDKEELVDDSQYSIEAGKLHDREYAANYEKQHPVSSNVANIEGQSAAPFEVKNDHFSDFEEFYSDDNDIQTYKETVDGLDSDNYTNESWLNLIDTFGLSEDDREEKDVKIEAIRDAYHSLKLKAETPEV